MNLKDKKIVIIHSGSDVDLSISDTLYQVDIIKDSLEKLGLLIEIIDVKNPNLLKIIAEYDKNTIVFNMVEDYKGSDSRQYQFTSLLDFFNITYTGASSEFLQLASNKILAKKLLKSNGIKTPKWLENKDVTNEKLAKKYIVKSVTEHCSLGIDYNSISDVNLAEIIEEKKKKYGGEWLAEEYISGREINVSMIKIDGKVLVLPILEMVFDEDFGGKYKIMDFDMKWDEEHPLFNQLNSCFKVNEDNKLVKSLTKISLKIWQIFKINSYVRIDFRIDENNQPFVIDINANPCLNVEVGVILSAAQLGLSQSDVLLNILKNTQN